MTTHGKNTMTILKVSLPKSVFLSTAMVLGAQYYLDQYYVEISDEGVAYGISLTPKGEETPIPDRRELLNRMTEAAFLIDQAERTREFRSAMLAKALSPYAKGDQT